MNILFSFFIHLSDVPTFYLAFPTGARGQFRKTFGKIRKIKRAISHKDARQPLRDSAFAEEHFLQEAPAALQKKHRSALQKKHRPALQNTK